MIRHERLFASNLAMRKSVASIMSDEALNDNQRSDLLKANVAQYVEHTGVPAADAARITATIAGEHGAPVNKMLEVLQPAAKSGSDKARSAPTFGNRPPSQGPARSPGPDEETRLADSTEITKRARQAIANRVGELRKANPRLSATAARELFYAENPGARKSLYQIVNGRPFGDEIAKTAPTGGSAETEFMAKVADAKAANPRLTDQQAYAAAYTDRANAPIVKRLKAELRGES